ncbi:MAG: hypothetical protein ACYTBZ_27420, partial [Planctomycetota bacterium]
HRIEKRLREEICPACTNTPSDQKCDEQVDICPLMHRLDELIEIVSSLKDYSLQPYQEKVREIICSACQQDLSGKCNLRDQNQCALEEYLPNIVAILEQEFKADPALS